MTCALFTKTSRRAYRVATLCRRRGIWLAPASKSRRPQARARALATVAATADFIPTGRRAPSDPRPAQLRERIRAAHTFDDVNDTDYAFGGTSTPRVAGGAFPVRCAECRILLVFRARQSFAGPQVFSFENN